MANALLEASLPGERVFFLVGLVLRKTGVLEGRACQVAGIIAGSQRLRKQDVNLGSTSLLESSD